MKILHEKAQSEISESNQYEKEIEEITGLAGKTGVNPSKRPRAEIVPAAAASTATNTI